MNGEVPTWESFLTPVPEKYFEKGIPVFWKNQVKDMHEVTVFK